MIAMLDVTIGVRVSPDEAQLLSKMAEEEDRTVAYIVRRMIRSELGRRAPA